MEDKKQKSGENRPASSAGRKKGTDGGKKGRNDPEKPFSCGSQSLLR